MGSHLGPEQYVSVCGMASGNEIEKTAGLHNLGPRSVLYGVQVSASSFIGAETKRGSFWYPSGPDAIADVAEATRNAGRGQLALHINQRDPTPRNTLGFVRAIMRACSEHTIGERSHGYAGMYSKTVVRQIPPTSIIQLNNLDWLSADFTDTLKMIRQMGLARNIILQANQQACQAPPDVFTEKLKLLPVNYVLLDTSGGTGTSFDRTKYAKLIEAIQTKTDIRISIAGGLGPNPRDLTGLRWLAQRFDNLSADAETKLRVFKRRDQPQTSRFSPERAAKFIAAATEIIGKQS
ncbi:hypothetical protein KC878_03070 [Candidatus Saccharibacteria bacterium]|nr:hypothetical protein [Candidatus Saccharibacteria bacterium]MCB9821705.1 hypothetical protein [Candidatus Nomurabacteria bacterium]